MKIKIEILSPIHIGSGQEISPIEYYLDKSNNKFIRLHMDGLFNDPDFQPLMENFIEQSKTQRYIGRIIENELLLKRHTLYSIDISPSAKETNPITVKEFIKSAGRVYIPGSSLKGSILSAIIWEKAKKIGNITPDLMELIIAEVSNSPMNNKFSRWLDVSDSNFNLPEECLELSLVKVKGATSGRLLPILYETVKVGTVFVTEIKTSLNSIYKFGKLTEKEILEITDKFYKKVYEKEKNSKLNPKLPDIPKDGFLARIGQGSTCLSTSFLLLAEELGINNYQVARPKMSPIKPGEEPRTRKLISQTISLGWVKLNIIT